MPQISASVKENTIKVVREMANEKSQTFSRMVDIILTTSAANWIVSKSKNKKKSK